MQRARLKSRDLAAAAAVGALFAVAPMAAVAAPGDATAITCTNPVSGATWEIVVDPGRATVDTNPARFSPGEISWHDPKDGGNYTLDRKSGVFVASVASSTGGYFRRGRCNMDTAR